MDINATNSAIALAEENKVDIADVKGSGDNGKILKKDVEDYLENEKVDSEDVKADDESVESPKKVETVSLSTSFRVRNKEGDRLNFVFNGSGKSLKEAIESQVCISPIEEEGKDFPRDLNILVNVNVKKGDYKFSRALAPHVARATLGKRENLEYLEKLLGLRK